MTFALGAANRGRHRNQPGNIQHNTFNYNQIIEAVKKAAIPFQLPSTNVSFFAGRADDLTNRVALEALAVRFILLLIETGVISLISSDALA